MPVDDDMKRDSVMTAAVVEESQVNPEEEAVRARSRRRFPAEIFFFLTAAFLQALNLGAHFELAKKLGEYATVAPNLSLPANITALRQLYEDSVAAGGENVNNLCDVPYFADNGFAHLSKNINSLKDATYAFFYIGIIPMFTFTIYKIGHLRRLYEQRTLKRQNWHPVRAPHVDPINPPRNLGNNPLGRVYVGDLSTVAQARRSERFFLRGETSGYVVLQIMHDIPLVMIFFLFVAFIERYRGLDCAVCVSEGILCTVPNYFSLAFSDVNALKFAIVACFLHISWNYLTLSLRWVYYFQTFNPPWNFAQQFLCWLLSTIAFAFSFIAPVAILFAVYVGPSYYGFTDVTTAIGLSAGGGAFWSAAFGVFLWIAGLEVGESIFSGLFCCNCWELFIFALPCCECFSDVCTVCDLGCGYCCC